MGCAMGQKARNEARERERALHPFNMFGTQCGDGRMTLTGDTAGIEEAMKSLRLGHITSHAANLNLELTTIPTAVANAVATLDGRNGPASAMKKKRSGEEAEMNETQPGSNKRRREQIALQEIPSNQQTCRDAIDDS
jgi:hypothetical protein